MSTLQILKRIILLSMLISINLVAQCVGNNYEQENLLPESIIKSVSISGYSDSIKSNESIHLTQTVETTIGYDDSTIFYYACTDIGELRVIDSSPNYKTIQYIAPNIISDKQAKISFKIGDGYGYIYTKILDIDIKKIENFSLSIQPSYTTFKNQPLTLSASTSNIDSENEATYSWNFGDGSSGSTKTVQHTYSTVGTYQAQVTVTYKGVTKTATTEVQVKEPIVSDEKDITNWKQILNGRYSDMFFEDGRFVAVGEDGYIATSTDGVNWQTVNYTKKDDIGDLMAVTYGNGKWVAVGGKDKKGVKVVSTDGLNWTVSNAYPVQKLTDVHFANNLFVSVGEKGIKYSSNDGEDWSSGYVGTQIDGSYMSFTSVTYDDIHNKWIAVGTQIGDAIFTSTDGNRWNENSFALSGMRLNSVDSYEGKTIAVGYQSSQGILLTSNDGGLTWNSQTIVRNALVIDHTDIGWIGALNNGDIILSSDGISWTVEDTNRNQWYTSFVYANSKLLATGHTWNIYEAQPKNSKQEFSISLSLHDGGIVTYDGGSCNSGSCTPILAKEGNTLTFNATPNDGYKFKYWADDCSGDGECSLNMSSNKRIEAHFSKLETLEIVKPSYGYISSTDEHIKCGESFNQCSYEYVEGNSVQLIYHESANATNRFKSWGGDINSLTTTTTIVMSENKNVSIDTKSNSLPIVTILNELNVTKNQSTYLDFITNDEDGDIVQSKILNNPRLGTLNIVGNRIIYTPNQNFSIGDGFSLEFNDGHGGVVEKNVKITELIVNTPPSISTDSNLTVIANTDRIIQFDMDDANELDIVAVTVSTPPSHGTIVHYSGNTEYTKFKYIPNTDYIGDDVLTVKADDRHGGVVYLTIYISVIDDIPPKKPTITVQPPTNTTANNITLEVNGEAGSKVYANGVEVATIGASGKVNVTLTLNNGDNIFNITLKDAQGNESEDLSFTVTKITENLSFNVLGNSNAIGTFDTSGSARDVTLSRDGTKAYVADSESGLQIIDISNPASPTKMGSFLTDGYAYDVVISSDETKAYVAGGSSGLQIIDISNPVSLTKLGSFVTGGYARSVTLSSDETKAYVSCGELGFQIIDISDPASPTKLGNFVTRGNAYDIVLSSDGSKAYVDDGYSKLLIIDISDPASPTKLGSFDTDGYAVGVTISSDETKAYVADGSAGLQIIDISDPASLRKLGSFVTGGSAISVTISSDENKAYVAGGELGFQIIDISNPSSPTKLGNFDDDIISHEAGGEARDVVISSDRTKAYLANGRSGLQIIDISNPASLRKLGSFVTDGYAQDVVISSDETKAYVAGGNSGLQIIDISNPSSPIKLGSFVNDGYAISVTISSDETRAYVADYRSGFLIIDISDPASPTKLGSFVTGEARDVVISRDGTKAYVANQRSGVHYESSGLQIIDISNPALPTKLGSFDTSDYAYGVTLSNDGTKVYLATSRSGLQIIDISNPASPTKLGSFDTDGYAVGVTISSDETKAYVSDGSSGLQIIDISDSASPTKLASFDTDGHAKNIALSSDESKAYVADGYSGLQVIDLTIDTIHGPKNFEDNNIGLKISTNIEAPITMNISTNRNDIVTIGNYDTELTFDEYNNQTINIPISSINGVWGQTIITVDLTYNNKTVTRTIYFNVYPLSTQDIIKPIITLNGNATITIELGNTYTELGASTDDGSTITINNTNVNINEVNEYIVTYNATDPAGNDAIQVTRTVKVVDTTVPTIPTTITQPPVNTTTNNVILEINGEVGSRVYVNGIEVGTIGADGKTSVTLNLNNGNNSFNITLRDEQENESEALNFNIVRDIGRPFITTWKTDNQGSSNDNQIKIATRGSGYNYNIDWGDGVINNSMTGSITHTYDEIGTYTIKIYGDFPQIYFDYSGYDNKKLLSIEQWGDIRWKSMENAFYGCSNLRGNSVDKPNLSDVQDMSYMFNYATQFNQNIGDWNVSHVTDMRFMFFDAENFNQDIGDWDVSNVTHMRGMFYDAESFDQDIGDWNVSKVSNMFTMFYYVMLSTKNYDSLLNKWSKLNLQRDLHFHGGNSKYSANSQVNRQKIIDNFGWTIDDADLDDLISPEVPTLTTPASTTANANITVEINGEVGAKVFVNGTQTATVGANGKVNVTLALANGDNAFSITLKDARDNESQALSFTVIRDTIKPVITLNGNAIITLELGGIYTEQGASADDGSTVTLNNTTVKTDTIGNYTVTYNAIDLAGNSAIEVIRSVKIVDSTKPVITLNGNSTITIELDSTYTELGASTDDSSTIMINSINVRTDTVGNYTVTYNATDAIGNVATEVTRTVKVADTTPPATPTLTTQAPVTTANATITVEVNGEAGAKVFVNGTQTATIGANGKTSITLALTSGDNSFDITLKDAYDNESQALSFTVTKENAPDQIALNSGYNLLQIRGTITEMIAKIGYDNLISIQGAGQGTVYKKSYADEGKGFLNSFQQTEFGKAYWVQVADGTDIQIPKEHYNGTKVITLDAGWNLISPLYPLTIAQIKDQLGVENLLVIQGAGQGTVYKKSYTDEGKDFLNSFGEFVNSQGYWIKVEEDAELRFLYE